MLRQTFWLFEPFLRDILYRTCFFFFFKLFFFFSCGKSGLWPDLDVCGWSSCRSAALTTLCSDSLQLVLELLIWDMKAYFRESYGLCQNRSRALFIENFSFQTQEHTWRLSPDLCYFCQPYSSRLKASILLELLFMKAPQRTGRVFSLVSWAAVSFLPRWQIPIFTLSAGAVGIEPSQMWWKWMLVKVVYRREQATVTLLSQAWNLSGTFLSPSREWGGNRGLCELLLIQSDQRVSVQHC